jgi:hypothetical protein
MSSREDSSSPSLALRSSIGLLSGLLAIAMTCGFSPAVAAESPSMTVAKSIRLAQDAGAQDDDTDVPPQDVDKYIKVYKAMQQNRNLTVEQAAAQQGLSVPAFRSLENRIQRNDALREHVRDSLKPKAASSPAQ